MKTINLSWIFYYIFPLTAKSRHLTAILCRKCCFLVDYSCPKEKREGDYSLKKFHGNHANVVAVFAWAVAVMISNSTCWFIAYQETVPEKAKKLRKF